MNGFRDGWPWAGFADPARTDGNRRGLVAAGTWIVDHIKVIDQWPAQDVLASVVRESKSSGGSPYNILKNLSRLAVSWPLAGIGLVGDDSDGHVILEDCRAHRIDTRFLGTTPSAATSYTDVMTLEHGGLRTFFHQRGANRLLGPEHFDFRGCPHRIFHLGYLLLLDRLDELWDGQPLACEVLKRAREAGLITSLDCVSEDSERFSAIVVPALPQVDVLFTNDFEAEKITGLTLRSHGEIDVAAVETAAGRILELGVREWVVVHFPEAVCACNRSGGTLWQPSLRVPPAKIAGMAGAGDALAAGVLYGFHDQWPMAQCLLLGVCTAAASACSEGVLPAADCLELAAQLDFNPMVSCR